MISNEFIVAMDNDNTVSIFKTKVLCPQPEAPVKNEIEREVVHLPSVGLINESMGIKSPSVIKMQMKHEEPEEQKK